LKDLVYQVNGAAIEVHGVLGPGLLESVYHQCMEKELRLRGTQFVSEMEVPVEYKGLELQTMLRCDFFIEGILVMELKSVQAIHPIHYAQIMTYMKLLGVPEGLLVNFNVTHIYSEGQQTVINEMYRELPE
jgi:GxxExxY protein